VPFRLRPGDAAVRRVPCARGVGEVLRYESRAVEVVDLALNASEDRVVGSLDLEAALREGAGSSRWVCWEGEREHTVHR